MVHPGLLSCLVHDLWLRVGDARHSHQVCGWQPIGRCSWSTQETGCHREEPIQPRGGDDSTLIKLIRTKNVVMSLGWADSGHQYWLGTLTGEQLFCRWQPQCEPAVCCGSKQGQWHLGASTGTHPVVWERSLFSSIQHLLDCILEYCAQAWGHPNAG